VYVCIAGVAPAAKVTLPLDEPVKTRLLLPVRVCVALEKAATVPVNVGLVNIVAFDSFVTLTREGWVDYDHTHHNAVITTNVLVAS
jgi:hypothetical protein